MGVKLIFVQGQNPAQLYLKRAGPVKLYVYNVGPYVCVLVKDLTQNHYTAVGPKQFS